jgi:hypothetical protein
MSTDIILTSDHSGLPAEPLVPDTVLAERLGYEHARDIRKLIKRNLAALGAMGLVRHHSAPIVSGKGRVQHVTTYSLNRAQAAFLVSKARTKRADSLAIVIAEVFAEFSEGSLIAKDAEAQARLDGVAQRYRDRSAGWEALKAERDDRRVALRRLRR